jgi:hypothetical protein
VLVTPPTPPLLLLPPAPAAVVMPRILTFVSPRP